jgi:hypothetical protein
MEKFYKYFSIVAAIGAVVFGVYKYVDENGAKKKDLYDRAFTTIEMRIKTEDKVENGLTPKQEQHNFIMDSLDKVDRKRSRSVRDSLMILKNRRDSLTAVTIFQLKASQEKQEVQIRRLIQN